ncbi:MAG TPA: hypothetical protein VIY49_21520 [Bryobacteraceae bacterium]
MRLKFAGSYYFLIALAATASAQTNGVFHFEHTQDTKSAQEMATAIRTVLDIPQAKVSDDNPPSTLTLGGTADQIKAAAWLFTQLDQAEPVGSMREYQLPAGTDNIARVYYVTNAQTIQQFQEVATAIRTIADIRRLYTYNLQKAIVARGSSDQMSFFDWLLPLMDRPVDAKPQHSISGQYTTPDPLDGPTSRIFYVGYAPSVKDFQSLATGLRTIAQFRRVYTYNAAQAIALRGTESELSMAEWLFNVLDQPGNEPASGLFRAAGADDVVQVFDLSQAKAGQDLPNVVSQIRSSTGNQYAFSFGSRSIMVLRGTAAQMAAAEHLVGQLSQP